jgi:hypothetical protein
MRTTIVQAAFRFPGYFSLLRSIQNENGAQPTFYPMDTEGDF